MRGAVAFALALHMQVESTETKRVILTTTLFLVLFTIIFMGGTALPMIKILSDMFPEEITSKNHRKRHSRSRQQLSQSHRKRSLVMLSKTQEMVFIKILIFYYFYR